MAGGAGRNARGFGRRAVTAERLDHASRLVELAWRDLPNAHKRLLENVGAAQWRVVDHPLGIFVDDLLSSAGFGPVPRGNRRELDRAAGVWIQQLRVVAIDAGHPALVDLDDSTYEAMIARIAWHEWGHALSVVRTTPDEVAAGSQLLELAPEGVREGIRRAGYRKREYTHEILAELYALLMSRRRRGHSGQPPWLQDELYRLLRRVSGWNE
jgi:hypothetical protein